MSNRKTILFINHAGTLRGASMSLLYTIEGIDNQRFNVAIAVAAPPGEVTKFYKKRGLNTVSAPELIQLHFSTVAPRHFYMLTTWKEIITFIFGRKHTSHAMDDIISKFNPDIVHLNSMPLSASALYLKRKNIPFVWHVREPPQTVNPLSCRRRLIGKWLRKLPNETIFLSNYDRQSWTGKNNGQVIPNFVDFNFFDHKIKANDIKRELNISSNSQVLLFVGGLRTIKGIFVLIQALKLIVEKYPNVICLMPGSNYQPPQSFAMSIAKVIGPFINHEPTGIRAIRMMQEFNLEDICLRLPYREDMPNIISAADIVIFPSIKPHFARPIVEASAMGKAVVASNLPGVSELVIENETGLLVPPNNHVKLADSICNLLGNIELRQKLGERGYKFAKMNFSQTIACEKIMSIYDKILNQ